MGVGITAIRVMTLEEMRSREIIGASQNGNKEWMILLVIVYLVIMKILSILIYQEKSEDLDDS